MLEHYELKAADHIMDNLSGFIEEDLDEEEEHLFKNLEKIPSTNDYL